MTKSHRKLKQPSEDIRWIIRWKKAINTQGYSLSTPHIIQAAMFSISKNRPLLSPSIKQAFSHSHGYPFPISPGSAGGPISRMSTPLPSPLINRFNAAALKTPPVNGKNQTLTSYPFPTKYNKSQLQKNLRFQTETVCLPTHSKNSNSNSLFSIRM